MPALFILVDEFSELLSQHPDFAELFVAIGRLGRSLGMHLLLASQRLDEGRLRGLETHLSYRICLKTFSASESRAVLGVPDAYHLPTAPGAAYLKTASGELVRFQTAFVSGLTPRTSRRRNGDLSPIAEANVVHRRTGWPHHRTESRSSAPTRTVFDTVAGPSCGSWHAGASGVATAADGLTHPRYVDSPCRAIAVPDGADRLGRLPVRAAARSARRRIGRAAGNIAIVGAPRSGKSTALRTLLMALAPPISGGCGVLLS